MSRRCSIHWWHQKRKWSTVSLACPQAHRSDGTTVIRWRYAFNLAIPVRSWASALASFEERGSYSALVCLPGNAVSIFFECFPTSSGSLFDGIFSRYALLRVVDRAPGIGVSRLAPSRVDIFAASFAKSMRSSNSSVGNQVMVMLFPPLRNLCIAS